MPTPANLVHQQSTTNGTGNLTLFTVNGRNSFSNAFGTGATTNIFDYFIMNQAAAEWERGTGHMVDSTTLVRDTVLESTNSNAAVNFSAGLKDVTNDVPAAKQIVADLNQTLTGRNKFTQGVTFGSSAVARQYIDMNPSGSSAPSALGGVRMAICADDNVNGGGFDVVAYGHDPSIVARYADGTLASPAAVAANSVCWSLSSRGWDGSAFSTTAQARIESVSPALWTGSSHPLEWHFWTTTIGSTTITKRWKMIDTGHFIPNSDISYNLGSSSNQIQTTYSTQISFPSTQNPSSDPNTLDDYEEGTWTPGISFAGGTTGITYSAQVGWYRKIGSLVAFGARIVLTSKGSSTGQAQVTGLPFATANVTDQISAIAVAMNTMGASVSAPGGTTVANSTLLNLGNMSAGTFTNLQDTDFTNTSRVNVGGSYIV